jgi:ABC-type uncharacterized transport system substrate-binding protein
VIAVAGGEPEALAAKVATETIPIAFNAGGDRVRQGLAVIPHRPGNDVTAVNIFNTQLDA